MNGSLLQSFTYDAHDKLTGGINEGESYDLNGNLLAQTLNGQTTRFAWDDEDRLTGQTFPDGHSDTYTYTGLGMRLRKNDPTGNYWYYADGVTPASDILSDGYGGFTPGISETHGAAGGGFASVFYLADAQGNSRGLLDGNQANPDGYNWDAFGNSASRRGTNPTAYAWNEESGYQSDSDSGLKLLGRRYYDSRTGRFISQDPAGAGDNWYAYCGNDPMNEADPEGMEPQTLNGGSSSIESPGYLSAIGWSVFDGLDATRAETGMNIDIKNLLQRHISPGAADAFAFMIFRGMLTYGMIGQTVGNGKNGSSGDTHHIVPGTDYSASTDLRIGKLNNKEAEELVNELAFFGFAAFLRIPGEDHWPSSQARHIHAVYAGASLTSSTQHQVMDFIQSPELNGLRSHAPYNLFNWNPGNVQAIYGYTH